jgi:methyl-accepting chemotaxis protein
VRLPSDWNGIEGQVAAAFNDILAYQDLLSREVERVSEIVGREGQLAPRMSFPGAVGGWASQVDRLNSLLDDLVRPTTEISRVIGAVTRGDPGQSIALEVNGRPLKGEFLRAATLVDAMIERLAVFTSEVTRVAREIGTEGKLGGQAEMPGASGTWKDLLDSVNFIASNLSGQLRDVAEVASAVAKRGPLAQNHG